ncbi:MULTISPECIES: hypothetical protein [Segatella]|jgi:hypothetical protein|uniref:hypothetical protein n=1 Tax=Segatella TaxID=2974251 RepID=UPI001291D69C|nr:hypothetical protein [Segatella copri]MBV3415501.1 hypothetical protein [Segatella copri]MBW0040839.1 hypothetical protein [Segatella copri]MEE0053864.1 hypothetical protein [Prevotella sp.]DAL37873.1 MAG TPA_asm: hypothetical protein [Caudoviricetes sp.]
MEEVINKIMEYIQKKTENFSYMDQQMMYDEIAGKLTDMSLDALKNEYLNNMEGTENE